jgi:hypothetical protein
MAGILEDFLSLAPNKKRPVQCSAPPVFAVGSTAKAVLPFGLFFPVGLRSSPLVIR